MSSDIFYKKFTIIGLTQDGVFWIVSKRQYLYFDRCSLPLPLYLPAPRATAPWIIMPMIGTTMRNHHLGFVLSVLRNTLTDVIAKAVVQIHHGSDCSMLPLRHTPSMVGTDEYRKIPPTMRLAYVALLVAYQTMQTTKQNTKTTVSPSLIRENLFAYNEYPNTAIHIPDPVKN